MMEDFEDAIQYARRLNGADLGGALRDLLFGEPEVLALFHRTRGAAADSGRQLLVRILAAPSALAAVPWELLLDPDGGTHQFLTLAPDAHIVRAARSRIYPVRNQPLAPPLNVLLILSSPLVSDHGAELAFDLFEEKRNLMGELQPLADAGFLQIDIEDHPTLENLRRRVGSRRNGYHVVHYLGHAVPEGVILEREDGQSHQVAADTFTDLLRLCPELRLAFFAGCRTSRSSAPEGALEGAPEEWKRALSTADRCVRESCPNVIGMRGVLPFRTEWLFSRFFYQGVTSGYTMADAVRLARAAIRGDEFVGGELLDWAVPSLIVGGDPPGLLIDTSVPVQKRLPVPRTELKLGLVQGDREFFSRLIQLRMTVDVLSGASADRVLVVLGSTGTGKTRLVDRALEDLADRLECVLYFRADRLLDVADPVMEMARWAAELLTRLDDRPRRPEPGWDGNAWWERLLSELTNRRFVIVIDDVQTLNGAENAPLRRRVGEALRHLASRRGSCRLALAGSEIPPDLLDIGDKRVAVVRLMPFTWDEIWRWIRRNLPALSRFGVAALAQHYTSLGNDLERWRYLNRKVAAYRGEIDLESLVREVLPPKQKKVARVVPEQVVAPRAQRPLRLAVAGPHLKGPDDFAGALTRLAARYGVGGRIPVAQSDTASCLATLLPVESPFREGSVEVETLCKWLDRVADLSPDIVLLDYGSFTEYPEEHERICSLSRRALLIAAGGNEGRNRLPFPAKYPEVLAVGALTAPGVAADYSSYDPAGPKPELFASTWARESPVSPALVDLSAQGTSLAAITVTAIAILIWATNPNRDGQWVRKVLLTSARQLQIPNTRKRRWREMDVDSALAQARESVVLDALRDGPLSLPELLAGAGMPGAVTYQTLRRLECRQKIDGILEGRTHRYQLR
jgi:hypothetical protein